ncbi:MAG: TIGR02996 domain-containing protein, partial [Pirellulaceae bacterium]|nr:TIGR02996 domain-containing protein [Pirellulaceae bacterium]
MLRSELFEQAVCDDPDNLELRLMFADWCEEQGDSRGEFVRLQLALDSLPEGHLWRFDYLERERELLKEHAGRWNAPLHRRINQTALKGAVRSRRGMVRSWSYRRGFVECLRVEPLAIDLHAELLFSLGPIRHLRIVGLITDWAAGVASCSRMEQLRSLDISCSELDTEGAAVLAGSRYLHQLHTLDVSCSEIGTAGISSFLESPGLDELKTLIAYGMVIPGALAQ